MSLRTPTPEGKVPLKSEAGVQEPQAAEGTLSKATELQEDATGQLGRRRAARERGVGGSTLVGGGERGWHARGIAGLQHFCTGSWRTVYVAVHTHTKRVRVGTALDRAAWAGVHVPDFYLFAVTLLDFPDRRLLMVSCSAVA